MVNTVARLDGGDWGDPIDGRKKNEGYLGKIYGDVPLTAHPNGIIGYAPQS